MKFGTHILEKIISLVTKFAIAYTPCNSVFDTIGWANRTLSEVKIFKNSFFVVWELTTDRNEAH